MTLTVRAAASTFLAAMTIGGLAAPASAQDGSYQDGIGNQYRADLYSVAVDHGKRLTVQVGHDDLNRAQRSTTSLALWIDVDRAQKGPEFVYVAGTSPGTDGALTRAQEWLPGDRVESKACDTELSLDYKADIARVAIDRSCLGRPDELRVEVRTTWQRDRRVSHDWLGSQRAFTPWLEHD